MLGSQRPAAAHATAAGDADRAGRPSTQSSDWRRYGSDFLEREGRPGSKGRVRHTFESTGVADLIAGSSATNRTSGSSSSAQPGTYNGGQWVPGGGSKGGGAGRK